MNRIYHPDSDRLKKIYLIVCGVITLIVFNPTPSFPFSIGGYFTTHYGEYNWNISQSTSITSLQNPPSKNKPVIPGGGLIWDAYLPEEKFIFRQSLGLEALVSRQYKMTRLSLVNTFAYVPFRTDSFIIWCGPQLNLHYLWGKDAKEYYGLYNNLIYRNIPVGIRRNYRFVTIGTGIALGLDYDFYENIKFSCEAGFTIASSVSGQSRGIEKTDASVLGYDGYVSISVMYHIDVIKKIKFKDPDL